MFLGYFNTVSTKINKPRPTQTKATHQLPVTDHRPTNPSTGLASSPTFRGFEQSQHSSSEFVQIRGTWQVSSLARVVGHRAASACSTSLAERRRVGVALRGWRAWSDTINKTTPGGAWRCRRVRGGWEGLRGETEQLRKAVLSAAVRVEGARGVRGGGSWGCMDSGKPPSIPPAIFSSRRKCYGPWNYAGDFIRGGRSRERDFHTQFLERENRLSAFLPLPYCHLRSMHEATRVNRYRSGYSLNETR